MANTEKKKDAAEPTITVMVAKRKSVEHDGVLYGPSEKLSLPVSDAKALYAKGFIVEPDDDDDDDDRNPAAAAADATGPTVQANGQDQ